MKGPDWSLDLEASHDVVIASKIEFAVFREWKISKNEPKFEKKMHFAFSRKKLPDKIYVVMSRVTDKIYPSLVTDKTYPSLVMKVTT